jgi:hypothetical protein
MDEDERCCRMGTAGGFLIISSELSDSKEEALEEL